MYVTTKKNVDGRNRDTTQSLLVSRKQDPGQMLCIESEDQNRQNLRRAETREGQSQCPGTPRG